VVDISALLANNEKKGAAVDVFPEEPKATMSLFVSELCGML
jgi:phosphoglycerate dehydrogenase-like enzyme